MLISAAVIHVIPAGVLCLVLAGITAGILGFVLTGVTAGILGAVLLRIHEIRSMTVSAVVHITVMISHNDSLLFGLVNLLQD
jgi:hydroxymethylglutaryl-CoA reductase